MIQEAAEIPAGFGTNLGMGCVQLGLARRYPLMGLAMADESSDVHEWVRRIAAGDQPETLYRGEPASFWIWQLKDRDPSLRQQAMWALAHLGPGQECAVHALAGMLKDKNEGVRSGAALNLGRMGAAAASAVPQLLAALRDDDPFVRVAALRALGSICPKDYTLLANVTKIIAIW